MEYQLNPRKAIDAVWTKKWIIIAVSIVSLFIGMSVTDPNAPDMYTASATIYSASYASYQESVEGINVMTIYVDIVRSRKVAERAAARVSQQISAEEIMGMISVSYIERSAVLTLHAVSDRAELAVEVVNAVSEAFVQEVANIAAVESVKTLDSAQSARPYSSGFATALKMRALILAAGLFAILCLVVLFALLDTRVAFPREVTLNGEIDLLGVIPERKI